MRAVRTTRRRFMRTAGAATAALAVSAPRGHGAGNRPVLQAGQGVVDTTPPLGIEMAGFHRPPGKERRITSIRQPTAARALVLRLGEVPAAIISLDICGVSRQMAGRVKSRVARQTGIPADHVCLCATHTHSMPTLRYCRQWGAISPQYMAQVERRVVRAVDLAQADLAPCELYVGKSRAAGANFNRTSKTWKTDAEFNEDSTDQQRWLDAKVRVMHLRRPQRKGNLLWYHFSAHPVCYTDDAAGPDWPGLVDQRLRREDRGLPSLLQGHIGDVNPGTGEPWLGDPEQTASRVAAAVGRAIDGARRIRPEQLRVQTRQVRLPLDMELFRNWLTQYRSDPGKCAGGPWVDARFAEDWFRGADKWDLSQKHLSTPLTAIRLGDLGLLLHPAELYSFYGLAIQRDSPLPDTFVVGYANALIGYLPDPKAYQQGEYAAIVVPKILDLPPFKPGAAGQLTRHAVELLKKLAG